MIIDFIKTSDISFYDLKGWLILVDNRKI